MGSEYHDGMAVPYESGGRSAQKARTRAALVEAARTLLASGHAPGVEEAAAAAGISRTTAYRYFPGQRDLLRATYPEFDAATVLGSDAPAGAPERLDLVLRELARINREWEPQLRAALRMSLDEPAEEDRPVMRRGRVIGWLVEALAPLARTHPGIDVRALAVAIRAATGIEATVWLTDIAGLSRADAAAVTRWAAEAMYAYATGGHPPPPAAEPAGPA